MLYIITDINIVIEKIFIGIYDSDTPYTILFLRESLSISLCSLSELFFLIKLHLTFLLSPLKQKIFRSVLNLGHVTDFFCHKLVYVRVLIICLNWRFTVGFLLLITWSKTQDAPQLYVQLRLKKGFCCLSGRSLFRDVTVY